MRLQINVDAIMTKIMIRTLCTPDDTTSCSNE